MKECYAILEHPSDVGIEVYAPTTARAFELAAEALISIIVNPGLIEVRSIRNITVDAADEEQLLVRWLSEILFLFDGEHFVGKHFHVEEIRPTSIRAEIGGEPLDRTKHETRLDIKAITYHQLSVRQSDTECRMQVFLDI